jgi:hypothetical protein
MAMTRINDGGDPAFPLYCGPEDRANASGMSLRDYFAAQAMQAMVTKSNGQDSIGGKKGVPLIAQYAYEFADAMLKAREAA